MNETKGKYMVKVGIITKKQCIFSQKENESFSDLLKSENIEDTPENERKLFVKISISTDNEKWWEDKVNLDVNLGQKIFPEWFCEKTSFYCDMFYKEVAAWAKSHILVDKEIEELSEGYYYLKNCKVERLTGKVKAELYDSTVTMMQKSAEVTRMYNHSVIRSMTDCSKVIYMFDESVVQKMYKNSVIQSMNDDSRVELMRDSSNVVVMKDDSTIENACENTEIMIMKDDSFVKSLMGQSTVYNMHNRAKINEMLNSSRILRVCDDSSVVKMAGQSSISVMINMSTVEKMTDNAFIIKMHNCTCVRGMYGEAKVVEMYDNAVAIGYADKRIFTSKSTVMQTGNK